MIIELICNSILRLFGSIFQNVVIAPFQSFVDFIEYLGWIVSEGVELFDYLVPAGSRFLFIVICVTDIVLLIYYIILWVLKKVPLASIS